MNVCNGDKSLRHGRMQLLAVLRELSNTGKHQQLS